MFEPDTDDDTDSVIDALQRDLEGDVIPADTFIDSLGSDFVNHEEVQSTVNGRPQRRLVLVNSTSVLDASGDARIVPTHIDSGHGGEMVNTTRFDMTAGDTDQEDVRSEGERPRRLVFPLSSGEIVEGPVDDEDRDGASEAGPEEYAADVTPLEARPRSQVIRSALESLDEVDLRTLFSQRASLMKNIPRFLVGPYRNAMRVASAEVGGSAGNQVLLERVGSCSSSSRGCSLTDLPEEG